MKEIRRLRVQNAILETLTLALLRGFSGHGDDAQEDSPSVHLTRAEMTGDGRSVTVFFTRSDWMADPNRSSPDSVDPKADDAALRWLEKNKHLLRRAIAASVSLQFVPELYFKKDRGLENTLRVEEILNQLGKGPA